MDRCRSGQTIKSRPTPAAPAGDRGAWRRPAASTPPSKPANPPPSQVMHELSIAMSIVELAEEEAERRSVQVNAVHLKLGALSGVAKEALLSCYELAFVGIPVG